MKHLRHGDLSFHKTKEVKGEKQGFKGSYVLALGEHTGHKHQIAVEEGTLDIYKDTDGSIFLVIDGKAILTHEEHKPVEFETGTYKMMIEREYDPFMKVVEQVKD